MLQDLLIFLQLLPQLEIILQSGIVLRIVVADDVFYLHLDVSLLCLHRCDVCNNVIVFNLFSFFELHLLMNNLRDTLPNVPFFELVFSEGFDLVVAIY